MTVAEHVVRLAVGGGQERTFRITHAVIAGWTGRDAGALQKHLRELREIGVSPPSSTPFFARIPTGPHRNHRVRDTERPFLATTHGEPHDVLCDGHLDAFAPRAFTAPACTADPHRRSG